MNQTHAIPDTKQWRDFFDCYRSLTALWNASSEEYRNTRKKAIAYQKLLCVYQKIHPNADIHSLKQRIINIKSCYKREKNKIKLSENFKTTYVPRLWYFSALEFLGSQTSRARESDDGNGYDNDTSNCDQALPIEELMLVKVDGEKRNQICESSTERRFDNTDVLGETVDELTNSTNDEAYVYALGWAASYRKLSETQKIYAKKAIEDILVLGQLNQLRYQTVPLPTDF